MQTVRRIYIYAMTFVSLQAFLWAVIGLVQGIFDADRADDDAIRLAGALAVILVSLPVFLLHWRLAQRDARRDAEERFGQVRAVFLYLTLLATLVIALHNAMILFNDFLLAVFDLPATEAILGVLSVPGDALVIILLNGAVAAYFYRILLSDWDAGPQGDDYYETRRLYRYLWLIYSLALTVAGIQQGLNFLLVFWNSAGRVVQSGVAPVTMLVNSLTLLGLGLPLILYTGRLIQRSLVDQAEKESLLRLVVLYSFVFVSVVTVLSAAAIVLYEILRLGLGAQRELIPISPFLYKIAAPLSVAVSFGLVWGYFGRILNSEMNAVANQPRRNGLRRLYFYVLALVGLGATILGLVLAIDNALDLLFTNGLFEGAAVSRMAFAERSRLDELAGALAILMVGLPLWIYAWRPMRREAAREEETGDHARRSIIRKAYLYLVIFAGVIGVMASAGVLFYNLFLILLGDAPADLGLALCKQIAHLLLFGLLLGYHWQALRKDNRLASQVLAKRHAQFPVLVLAPEESEFAENIVGELERQMPGLPVFVHPFRQGVPTETLPPEEAFVEQGEITSAVEPTTGIPVAETPPMSAPASVNLSAARAVILPAGLLAELNDAYRLWLQAYSGERLVVPTPVKDWHWLFGSGRSMRSLSRQAARVVRQLAEEEGVSATQETSPWMIVFYVFLGLLGLGVVCNLLQVIIGWIAAGGID